MLHGRPAEIAALSQTNLVAPPHVESPLLAAGRGKLATSEHSYRHDEEIYGESEPAEYVYQVVKGAVRTYQLLADGRRQITGFHLPGDVFGLDSGPKHRATAEAIVDTTARIVRRRALDAAANGDPEVACALWKNSAEALQRAQNHMLLLGRKNAVERVAAFLLEMDRRLLKTGMVTLPMCRRDIGDYLGLTLETVSRSLSQLHDEGVVDFSGARQIAFRNRARLATLNA